MDQTMAKDTSSAKQQLWLMATDMLAAEGSAFGVAVSGLGAAAGSEVATASVSDEAVETDRVGVGALGERRIVETGLATRSAPQAPLRFPMAVMFVKAAGVEPQLAACAAQITSFSRSNVAIVRGIN